jgi:3-dehydroquinate synthase
VSTGVAASMREIPLLSYRIVVGRGALKTVGDVAAAAGVSARFALISDAVVSKAYGPVVERALGKSVRSFVMPIGESHKTRDTWARLTDELIAAGFGRDTCIVALGGGVVGDVAGFVAATYMRGVPVIHLPTSLLAMIDASIGGKTGVDTPAGKNLVGAFHQPAAVVVDPDVLSTLPAEHLRAGLAEAIKHGAIRDAAYFDSISSHLRSPSSQQLDLEWLTDLVIRGIEIKASVVATDEREHGLRKTLNFGHTIGHAVEVLSNYRMLHGEAVAIGMAVEADIAERIGVADRETANAIRSVLRQAGLPTASGFPAKDVLNATRTDKKSRGGRVEYALPKRVGAMAGAESGWSVPVPDEVVQQALDASD